MVPRNVPVVRQAALVRRVYDAFASIFGKAAQLGTTNAGVLDLTLDTILHKAWDISPVRADAYRDAKQMEEAITEVAAALDVLADEAVNAEGGGQDSYTLVWDDNVPKGLRKHVEHTLQVCHMPEKMYATARDLLLYGDEFVQFVINDNMELVRTMYMPPESMVRNEDEIGLLKSGSTPGEYAFEQYLPSTRQFVAGFRPWQIDHLRWDRSGAAAYGRSICFTARPSWKKLQAMEEALVINWVTRAFARLLFMIDTTGLSAEEADRKIREFKNSLTTKSISSGVIGQEVMSIVKDLFVGVGYHEVGGSVEQGLTDVRVLDTSSAGFSSLDPVEYYQNKIITAMRVPKAYLGLERDINAKATLSFQDRRFARTIRRVQSVLGEHVIRAVQLVLLLRGLNPLEYKVTARWPNPSRSDVAEEALATSNMASAAETLMRIGVADSEYVATQMLQMSQQEWTAVAERVEKEMSRRLENERNTETGFGSDSSSGDRSGDRGSEPNR